jgi:Putative peptidoglycan binding domain.
MMSLTTAFFVQPILAQRDEWGARSSGPPCDCHRLRATLQVAMVLLLHGQRAVNFATGLRGFDADSVAPAGLLLRAVDGVFTPQVAEAIARLQKNYSMRVTGTLTDSVRRALHMP